MGVVRGKTFLPIKPQIEMMRPLYACRDRNPSSPFSYGHSLHSQTTPLNTTGPKFPLLLCGRIKREF